MSGTAIPARTFEGLGGDSCYRTPSQPYFIFQPRVSSRSVVNMKVAEDLPLESR